MLIIALLLVVGFGRVFSQEWVQSSGGEIPDHALKGGTDTDGSALYVCKASRPGETSAGKVNARLGNCRIPYFDEEHIFPANYEVLTSPPWEDYKLEWTAHDYSNGAVPDNAVRVDKKGVYVGRYNREGRYTPGKIVVSNSAFYYGYDGREYETSNYKVLLKTLRSIDYYELYNVEYNLDQVAYDISPDQITLSHTTVVNVGSYVTTASLPMDFEDQKSRKWSFTSGFEVHAGINMTVTAALPIFGPSASTAVELGVSASTSYTHGGVYETSKTTYNELTVNLPACSNVSVSLLTKRLIGNIPYTGTLKVVFANGESYTQSGIEGMYTGVQSTSLEVSIKSTPWETGINEGIKTVSTFSIWIPILFLNFHMNTY